MGDHQDSLSLSLQLNDERIEAVDDILVGLASWIPVSELVRRPGRVLFWIPLRDLGVGQSITDSCIDLVQGAELQTVSLER